ncbi:heparan-alpha-glucosaminide N-acetyltransferase [Handroanthus impetiginosus]|uniref:Heparan-alpha-glucosaminide N-acetyltransferase n=1 Tax=Handroanthus impetiginosus TaxID=429701 RepID=A0A2G9HNQ2_9LAMI|nr:heparan-alpha-glucosaminide N-acetyltransferase [Handroanthus impetiginosus]
MAEIQPLLQSRAADEEGQSEREEQTNGSSRVAQRRAARVASLDVFRGLCVFLMMLVDYAGSIFPIIAHVPWNGLHLADFVMPFFLFVAGVSVAIVYKKVSDRVEATWKVLLRALKLFLLGVLLQGGYFHGVNSLTYGVDVGKIRLLGILQRIAIGYLVAALCEIWLPCQMLRGDGSTRKYTWQGYAVLLLCAIYLGLLYGLYVPDWQFSVVQSKSSLLTANDSYVYTVKCSVRGDLGPACNAAGMIDRVILGINHLYAKPVYRNLKECNMSSHGQVPETSPSWCHAPFDPEGILSSLTAAVTCIIGLQYGHALIQLQHHKERLWKWFISSVSLMGLGLLLALLGIPLNKSLSTISYMMVTSATAGITFCMLYMLVDVYGWRKLTFVLEWMGKHSLSIFILVTSNIVVIAVQGFYLKSPENNIVHWIISRFVHE